MRHRWLIAACLVFVATPTLAGGEEESGLPGTLLRVALGATFPLSDLANDSLTEGWAGMQKAGITGAVSLRYALQEVVYLRPEIFAHRFGAHEGTDTAEDPPLSWTRRAMIAGFRVNLDYIPTDRQGWTPFITSGLGLAYLRYRDEIEGDSPGDLTEETVGATAQVGLGLWFPRFEVLLSGTLQEPNFDVIGRTSWTAVDLTISYALPIAL